MNENTPPVCGHTSWRTDECINNDTEIVEILISAINACFETAIRAMTRDEEYEYMIDDMVCDIERITSTYARSLADTYKKTSKLLR